MFRPTSFCYKSDNASYINNQCAAGVECCNVFINGKGDCGPPKYCEEQIKGAFIIFGIVFGLFCLSLCCCCCFAAFKLKSDTTNKNTREVEFDNIQ